MQIRRYAIDPEEWWITCRVCGLYWESVRLDNAIRGSNEHALQAHACPSMRASGEMCDEYCNDCGGELWLREVKLRMTDTEFIWDVEHCGGLIEAFECGMSHKNLDPDTSYLYGAVETAYGLYGELQSWVNEVALLEAEVQEERRRAVVEQTRGDVAHPDAARQGAGSDTHGNPVAAVQRGRSDPCGAICASTQTSCMAASAVSCARWDWSTRSGVPARLPTSWRQEGEL